MGREEIKRVRVKGALRYSRKATNGAVEREIGRKEGTRFRARVSLTVSRSTRHESQWPTLRELLGLVHKPIGHGDLMQDG